MIKIWKIIFNKLPYLVNVISEPPPPPLLLVVLVIVELVFSVSIVAI